MAKEDLTLIVAVIDASGSMEKIKDGVIDGFNEFISSQKEVPGDVIFSMIQFSSGWNLSSYGTADSLHYKEIYDLRNLKEITPLDETTYTVGGGTPLLAAMDKAIDSVGAKLAAIPEISRPSKVVFVTITDGQENTSDKRKYSKIALAQKTKHQQEKYNWKFIYLGMHPEAFAEAGGIGFLAKNTIQTEHTVYGLTNSLNTISRAVGSYRTTDEFDLEK